MNKLFISVLCATVFSFGTIGTTNASVILDTTSILEGGGTFAIGSFSFVDQNPLGQSFILNQSTNNLMIGGLFDEINQTFAPTLSLVISLVKGAGTGGELLGSSSFTLSDGFRGLHSEDFSSLGTLAAGTYTALFSQTDPMSLRGGLTATGGGKGDPNSDPYNTDGIFTIDGNAANDFRVQVTGDFVTDSQIPEPTTITLIIIGLIGLFRFNQR